jgi:hypothetical protein
VNVRYVEAVHGIYRRADAQFSSACHSKQSEDSERGAAENQRASASAVVRLGLAGFKSVHFRGVRHIFEVTDLPEQLLRSSTTQNLLFA